MTVALGGDRGHIDVRISVGDRPSRRCGRVHRREGRAVKSDVHPHKEID